MENNNYNHFDRTFDIDGMLYDNAKWLAKQTGLSTREFVEIAEQLSMTQKDWTTFWRMVKEMKKESEMNKRYSLETIEVFVTERETEVTEHQFEALQEGLGVPAEESNCCGVDVAPHNANDHTSICMDCREGCGIVYIF